MHATDIKIYTFHKETKGEREREKAAKMDHISYTRTNEWAHISD